MSIALRHRPEHAHDISEVALALGGFLGALDLPHRENIERCGRLAVRA